MAMDKKIPSITQDGIPNNFVLRIVSEHTPPTLDLSTTATIAGSIGSTLSSIVGVSGTFDDDLVVYFSPVDNVSIMGGTNKLVIPAGSTSGMLLVSSTVGGTFNIASTNNLSSGSYNKNFHCNNFKTSQNLSINIDSDTILDNSANLIYNSHYYKTKISEPIYYTPGYPTSKKIKIPEGYNAPPQGSLLIDVQDYSGLAADLALSSQIAFVPKTAYAYPKDSVSVFNNKAASIEPDIAAGSLRDGIGRTTGYPNETFPYQANTSSVVYSVYVKNLDGQDVVLNTTDGEVGVSSSRYFALAIGTSGVSGLTPEAYEAITTSYNIENEYAIAIFEWDDTGALVPSGVIIDPIWLTADGSPIGSLSCGVFSGVADDVTKYGLSAADDLAGNGDWYRAYIRVKVPTPLRKTYIYANSSKYGEGAIHTRYIAPGIGGSDLSLPGLSGQAETSISIPTAVSGVQLCLAQLDYFNVGDGEPGFVPRQFQYKHNSSDHPIGNIFNHPSLGSRFDRFNFS